MPRRARVKVKPQAVTRAQAAAEFGRKKAKLKRKQSHRRMILIGAGLLACYSAAGMWWLSHTGRFGGVVEGVGTRFWQATSSVGFTLDQVLLTGRNHADIKAVKDALQIEQGAPILALPLEQMQQRLEAVPEIKRAAIARKLPGILEVAITERLPAALWQTNGKLRLIDREGVVLNQEKYREKLALPLVVGADVPAHVGPLLALLDTVPSLRTEVVAAVRVGGRRWNIELTHHVTVMLPEEAPEAAWKRFAKLVNEKALLSKAIRSVDMRMEDRVFIMPIEEHRSMITLTTARDT